MLRALIQSAAHLIILQTFLICTAGAAETVPGPPSPDTSSQGATAPVASTNAGPDATGDSDRRTALTIEQAVMLALQNNPSLKAERLTPDLQRTYEQEARAAFDPVLSGSLSKTTDNSFEELIQGSTNLTGYNSKETDASISLNTTLPTGTSIELGGTTDNTDETLYGRKLVSSRGGLTVSQSLLKGFGTGANLATLREARIDTDISEYEFRGFAEAFVAQVEDNYWDYALAKEQLDIFERSVKLAEQQLDETSEQIKVGKLAQIEIAAAQAELALRHEALINAKSSLASARLRFIASLNLHGTNTWESELTLKTTAEAGSTDLDDVGDHVAVAMVLRPDINQAILQIRRDDLEIVRTRNGLLPKMDVFVTLGNTGYASSFADSLRRTDGSGKDAAFGVSVQYPLGSRADRATNRRAVLSREMADDALENLMNLANSDVRTAYVEVNRTVEQITATKSTRVAQEAKLLAETEKMRVGKSTSLLVAQAERDLLQSQIDEVSAVVAYLKARTDLYRLDGSLLMRRHIDAPGRTSEPNFLHPEHADPDTE